MNYDKITLTPEQAKLFNKLKAAYKACEKAGIYFVNNYGRIEAYDGALVDDYMDSESLSVNGVDVFSADDLRTNYSFTSVDSFADDDHFIRLTPKGLKALNQ